MERGVYGIGGFLQVSGELQVLWSGAYLPVAQKGFRFSVVSGVHGFRVCRPSSVAGVYELCTHTHTEFPTPDFGNPGVRFRV